ncbi:MAG TPA: DNA-processing protein DprA [Fimbriimonadales bacterium]|nr:DNA-processing protein DprA [Fimbriimonadales bacterium]
MRQISFWQALLYLDLPTEQAHKLFSQIEHECFSLEDLRVHHALPKQFREKLQNYVPPQLQEGIRLISIEDEEYLSNLRAIPYPPLALYVKGKLALEGDVEENSCAVAIVGTRKATTYGKAVARQLSNTLSKAGITVISGGAYGIDAQAHEGALECGGKTIAVLGSGVDVVYPASNRSLFERITAQGALVSQFELGTKADWWRFPLRNMLIASLANAVIVVQAPEKSGAIGTATFAAEQGIPVFVTPAPIDDLSHRGSFRLINDGATLLYSPEQIFDELGVEIRIKKEEPKLSKQQASILQRLSREPLLVDTLSEQLELPAGVVLAELTDLELQGLVAKASGGYVRL